MISSESEYQAAVARAHDQAERLKQRQAALRKLGLSGTEIKRGMDPLRSFHEQLLEEIAGYERLKRGEFEQLENFEDL